MAMQTPQKYRSAKKELSKLLAIPTNRSCAECRSPLLDSSQIYVSFSPFLGDPYVPSTPPPLQCSTIRSFKFHHETFDPLLAAKQASKRPIDPAMKAVDFTGGHGVFVCRPCGSAHGCLGSNIAMVRSIQDSSDLKLNRVEFLGKSGGNARSWAILEAYIPETWQSKRPTNKSTIEERELFCRAKYQVLAFLTPLGGPLSSDAWMRLLALENKTGARMDRWNEGHNLDKFGPLTIRQRIQCDEQSSSQQRGEVQLPTRLVDYFCVVGHSSQLTTNFDHSLVPSLFSPNQLSLEPSLIDCYPQTNTHSDMDFPEHISTFVFPDGIRPMETRMAPTFFTFVLTSSSGVKLYGASLHIYDDSMETEDLVDVLDMSGYDGALPPWLVDDNQSSDIVFLPKSLVVISHYPLYSSWRKFLIELYRISLVESPLPIERYVVNFVNEVPLPPQGKIEIKFGFTSESQWFISRPAPNKLPIADFSYRPIFSALSVENIMVIIGCLMEETPVALLCGQYSMLGAVSEALLSLLFPFEWQGLYLPLIPSSMTDILEAPVPFLVGLHSRYLTRTKPRDRPTGVVFVDLDADIVHLGFDGSEHRKTPSLPEKEASKLKAKLQEFGAMVYIVPELRKKEYSMTSGNSDLLDNTERDAYARKNYVYSNAQGSTRAKTFAKADKAVWDDEGVASISSFLSEQGQVSDRKESSIHSQNSEGKTKKKIFFQKKNSSDSPHHMTAHDHLMDSKESNGFSSNEIRNTFLRFFVTIFRNYEKFLVEGSEFELFRREEFLDDLFFLTLDGRQRQFLSKVVSSQMFQSFLEVGLETSNDPNILFFNESIVAKNNRSKKKTLTTGGKRETPFLDDISSEITATFIPAAPSNWGLPDDGRRYSYGSFPKLDQDLMGNVRLPKQWSQESKSQKSIRRSSPSKLFAKQKEVIRKAMQPRAPISMMIVDSDIAIKIEKQDVEWAISTLTSRNAPKPITPFKHRTRNYRKQLPIQQTNEWASTDALATAQTIIMSARRKQGILLEVITKIQGFCRRYLDRKHCQEHRKLITSRATDSQLCVVTEQEQENPLRVEESVVLIQCNARKLLARRRFLRSLLAVSVVQRNVRVFFARRQFLHAVSAVIKIQRKVGTFFARSKFLVLRKGTVLFQAAFRGRRVRFTFAILENLISKLQAVARGYLTRQVVQDLIEKRLSAYRSQIVDLWQRTHTPLSYRMKFWPFIDCAVSRTKCMYLNLVEEELSKLWGELGIKALSSINASQDIDICEDDILVNTASTGMTTRTYRQFLKVDKTIAASEKQMVGKEAMPIFPAESSTSVMHAILIKASHREHLEKNQLYEKLNTCADKQQLQLFYAMFDISPKEKEKKLNVIDKIWRSNDFAKQSTEIMISFFPELHVSTDIHWVKPSKKGMKRMHIKGPFEAEPLHTSMCIQSKVQNRINSNLRELAVARLAGRKALLVNKKSKRKANAILRQQNAIMRARGYTDWICCRYDLIIYFLYHKTNP